jgi:outer membrane protein assembly factor BamB
MNCRSFTAAVLVAIAAGCAMAQSHPWAMRYSNAQRTGQSAAAGALSGDVAWKYRVPGNVPQFAASSSGDIILGVTFNRSWWSEEEFLSSIDADGKNSWRKKMVPYQWGFSQGVSSSPALDSQGNLIVPSPNAQLVKIDPNLNVSWTYQENNSTINDSSPAVLADDSIRHVQGLQLRALSPSGSVLWTASAPGSVSSVAVAPNLDMAQVGSPVDQSNPGVSLRYWNADGTIRWSKSINGGGINTTPVFGSDGILYVSNRGGTAVAYNPDGSIKWSDPSPVGGTSPALGKNGQVYFMGGNRIRALNKDTGAVLWTTTLPGSGTEGIAIDSRDMVYVTTSNGYLVSINPNGSVLWQLQVCDSFTTGPIVGPNNLCVAAGKVGFEQFVYAIR